MQRVNLAFFAFVLQPCCVKTTIIMLRNLTQLAPFALLLDLATRIAIAQKLVPFVQTR